MLIGELALQGFVQRHLSIGLFLIIHVSDPY